MKILVVNNFYYPHQVGGAEESLRLQCEALVELGQEVHVLTVAHDGVQRTHEINGVLTHYLRTTFFRGSPLHKNRNWLSRVGWQFGAMLQFGTNVKIAQLLKRERYGVVYVNNLPGIGRAIVIMARALGIPVVAGLRDYAWICLRQSRFEGGKNCQSTCMKCRVGCSVRRGISLSVEGVAANSATLLAIFQEAGAFKNVPARVIYAGAPLATRLPRDAPPPREEGQPLVVGVMGQIQPSKGFDSFLGEVSPLIESRKISVIITGSVHGEYATQLKDAFESEHVTFTGRLEREDFFSRVDVVVIPSMWNEPLSRITYEALSNGKCVVASTHGGQKEIISHGDNGYIYTPGDGTLMSILTELIRSPALLKDRERAAAESAIRYSPQNAAAELLTLFEPLVSKP
ncbi:glycosyltransferase [Stenotrophomonas bentonitica]